jgi:hypothetical protein
MKFWLENLKGRDCMEDLGIEEYNIRMDFREIGWEDVDWMYLSKDRVQWWAVL